VKTTTSALSHAASGELLRSLCALVGFFFLGLGSGGIFVRTCEGMVLEGTLMG
jgi:hypothetical protein